MIIMTKLWQIILLKFISKINHFLIKPHTKLLVNTTGFKYVDHNSLLPFAVVSLKKFSCKTLNFISALGADKIRVELIKQLAR